jgi:hypothetical protein
MIACSRDLNCLPSPYDFMCCVYVLMMLRIYALIYLWPNTPYCSQRNGLFYQVETTVHRPLSSLRLKIYTPIFCQHAGPWMPATDRYGRGHTLGCATSNLKGFLGHHATMPSTQAEDSNLEKSASILRERRFKLSRYCFYR